MESGLEEGLAEKNCQVRVRVQVQQKWTRVRTRVLQVCSGHNTLDMFRNKLKTFCFSTHGPRLSVFAALCDLAIYNK